MIVAKVWVKFVFLCESQTGKTKVWEVQTLGSDLILGSVKWFGKWRRYSFYPGKDMVFEQNCLRVIADYCEQKTREHRKAA